MTPFRASGTRQRRFLTVLGWFQEFGVFDPNSLSQHHAVPVFEFRRQALSRLLDMLRAFRRRWESRTLLFQARESVPLLQYQELDELSDAVKKEAARLIQPDVLAERIYRDRGRGEAPEVSYAEIAKLLAGPTEILTDLTGDRTRGGLRLLEAYNSVMEIDARFGEATGADSGDLCRLSADDTYVYFFVTSAGVQELEDGRDDPERRAWQDRAAATRFVASVAKLLQKIRGAGRKPNAAEAGLVRAAYEVLGHGTAVAIPYQSLGVPGFKPIQTWLFLTDPGEGHLQVTCHRKDLFEKGGAAVHIEHIDRDEEELIPKPAVPKSPRTLELEAYRLPAPINVAKVRLHIGPDAPSTAFIGRPVFENRNPDAATPPDLRLAYRLDRLKSAHMTAATCTAMYLNGVAECKIAIERMTAADAVDFMRAVAGNVFRDRYRQYLSAAFNIFRPIYDDFSKPDRAVVVDDPRLVCQLGIKLAAAGGFDKVTWDGAHPTRFPSLPILARWEEPLLDHEFWVRMVHEAHLHGLTTYVSAGLEPQHMPRAVYAALDGVGIGVKLHYFDKPTKRTGDFDPEVMTEVLDTARKAQATTLGRAAKILARLGRMKYEGILCAPTTTDGWPYWSVSPLMSSFRTE